jgi:hypothetical protein
MIFSFKSYSESKYPSALSILNYLKKTPEDQIKRDLQKDKIPFLPLNTTWDALLIDEELKAGKWSGSSRYTTRRGYFSEDISLEELKKEVFLGIVKYNPVVSESIAINPERKRVITLQSVLEERILNRLVTQVERTVGIIPKRKMHFGILESAEYNITPEFKAEIDRRATILEPIIDEFATRYINE